MSRSPLNEDLVAEFLALAKDEVDATWDTSGVTEIWEELLLTVYGGRGHEPHANGAALSELVFRLGAMQLHELVLETHASEPDNQA